MDSKPAGEAARIMRRLLEDYCAVIEIAGAMRRGDRDVPNLSFVCTPAPGTPAVAFGMRTASIPASKLHARIDALKHQGVLRIDHKKDGPKLKRIYLTDYQRLPIDIHLADRHNFGNTMIMQTGDVQFVQKIFARAEKGGLLAPGFVHDKGYLVSDTRGRVSCPTEQAFFEAIGLPYLEPGERNITTARALWIEHRQGRVVIEKEVVSDGQRQEYEATGKRHAK